MLLSLTSTICAHLSERSGGAPARLCSLHGSWCCGRCGSAALSCGKALPFRPSPSFPWLLGEAAPRRLRRSLNPRIGTRFRFERPRKGGAFPQDRAAEPLTQGVRCTGPSTNAPQYQDPCKEQSKAVAMSPVPQITSLPRRSNNLQNLKLVLLVVFAFALASLPSASAKTPIILDTDIGSDIDDAFALALIVNSPELELVGVTTVSGDTQARARLAAKLLWEAGPPGARFRSMQASPENPNPLIRPAGRMASPVPPCI